MVLSILYGKKYQKGSVGSIQLDVTLRENHRYNSRVTTYPVEDGVTLSDHIINEPINLVIEGIVTDTPLAFLSLFNRSIDTFNKLIQLYERKEIVSIVTGIKVYQNMAITILEVPREVRTGQSLTFTIELQEILLDDSVRVELNEQNIFGGTQSIIRRGEVKSGNEIPLIQQDPENSLKDQATSGTDFGVQGVWSATPETVIKLNQSLGIIGL